tara:strand:+ start:2050 stop:2829 length:780 start_codon:yes stop_codon:yes gene_type:complete
VKIYFISFATHNYGGALQNQKRLAQQAVEVGNVDGTKLFRETDIPHFFRQATELFKDVELVYPRLRHSKYFVWKPQVIIKMLHSIRRDDIVIYHDAGRSCYNYKIDIPLRPFCEYVVNKHNGLFVNFGPFKNGKFTKRECFEVMGCYEDFFINHNQANASWGIFQKCPLTYDFLFEWRRYCMHESLIVTDNPGLNKEHDSFDSHRHDQSILTNLLLLYSKHRNLPLDPKVVENKIKKPWGFEKNMCNAIKRIDEAYGLR